MGALVQGAVKVNYGLDGNETTKGDKSDFSSTTTSKKRKSRGTQSAPRITL